MFEAGQVSRQSRFMVGQVFRQGRAQGRAELKAMQD